MSGPSAAVVTAAIETLGLRHDASWNEVRAAYRRRIREVHPDVAVGDTTEQAAQLNHALAVLRRATNGGVDPLPAPPQSTPVPPEPASTADTPVVTLRARGDVFVDLLDAAYEIGDVNYMDPEAGLIQVLLDDSGSRLLIAIDLDADPVRAAFQLDSPDAVDAPALRDVVATIGSLLAMPEA